MVTAEMVKDLREKTGAGLMDCKEALTASDGRMDDAVNFLRKRNLDKGAMQNKLPSEGRIAVREDNGAITIVEMSANTDFVANSAEFRDMLNTVVAVAHENKLDSIEKVNAYQTETGTIEQRVKELAGKLGENITLTQLARYEGPAGFYMHNDNKQAAIVEVEGAADGLAQKIGKDIAMHIVFAKPKYLNRDQIPAELVEKEKKLLTEIASSGDKPKPANVTEKIVQGKMGNFYGKFALLDQPYYRDQKQTVSQVLKVLGDVKIKKFTRFEVGSIGV